MTGNNKKKGRHGSSRRKGKRQNKRAEARAHSDNLFKSPADYLFTCPRLKMCVFVCVCVCKVVANLATTTMGKKWPTIDDKMEIKEKADKVVEKERAINGQVG